MSKQCQATIKASTYTDARRCSMRWGLKIVGKQTLCVHHQKMAVGARL